MVKQPAAGLDAGLVVKKGAAAVTEGAPQRGVTPSAPPPVASPASKIQGQTEPADELVPLNFRVPRSFREEFEEYAFNTKPRRKMVALLKDAFLALKQKEGK